MAKKLETYSYDSRNRLHLTFLIEINTGDRIALCEDTWTLDVTGYELDFGEGLILNTENGGIITENATKAVILVIAPDTFPETGSYTGYLRSNSKEAGVRLNVKVTFKVSTDDY